MNHRSRSPLTAAGLALVAASLLPSPAQAGGFQLREQSPSAQGNAFAGVSAGGFDIGSMFFNPATLTQFSGMEAILGMSQIAPKAELGSAAATPFTLGFGAYPAGPASYPNAAKTAVVPNIYALWSLSPDLKLGLAVNAPFGMVTDYDSNFLGRYHALKSDLKIVDIAPSIAYRVNAQWSVGASLLFRKTDATLTNAVDFGTIMLAQTVNPATGAPTATTGTYMSLGVAPGRQDGIASLKGSKQSISYKLGVTFQPTEDLRLGLAYHAANNINLSGDATFQMPTTIPAPLVAGGALLSLQSKGFRDNTATAEVNLPSTTSLGLNYNLSRTLSLQAEVAQTGWSTFKELRVKFSSGLPDSVTEEKWKNTMFYSVGLNWKATESLTLRAGLATDQSSAEDAYRTPRIPDGDRTWLSVGAGYAFSKSLSFDVAYTHILVKDGPLGLLALPAGTTTTTSPNTFRGNLSGTYKNGIDIVALQARFIF
jgi:long-chain fatty acid transport protein